MSGLFCDEPRFLYRSPNDAYMLEIFHDGKFQLLDFKRGNATVFKSMDIVQDLLDLLEMALSDYDRREKA